jgi:hypothetical protein
MLDCLDKSITFCIATKNRDCKHTEWVHSITKKDISPGAASFFCGGDLSPEVDFSDIQFLSDYFGSDESLQQVFLKAAQEAMDDPYSMPLQKLTAFEFSNHPGTYPMVEQVSRLNGIKQLRLVKYCIGNHAPNILFPPIDFMEEPMVRLGAPTGFSVLLGLGHAVVAGGASMHLLNPLSKWKLNSDIDVFLLKGASPLPFVELLQKCEYTVCQSSPSVLTAIGVFGKRRIQVISSTAETAVELISNFDLNCVRSFFDGKRLYAMASAIQDSLTMSCSNGQRIIVKPERLAKIHLKGLQLMPEAKEYLRLTLGWPLPTELVDRLLYQISFITPGIPEKVQREQLKRMKLYPLDNMLSAEVQMTPMFNSYGPQGVFDTFKGSPEEFVAPLQFVRAQTTHRLTYIDSQFLLRLPLSSIPFKTTSIKRDDTQCIIDRFRLTIVNVENTILPQICDAISRRCYPSNVSAFSSQALPDLRVFADAHTSWVVNGIVSAQPKILLAGTRVEGIMRPSLLARGFQVKFLLIQVFIQIAVGSPKLEHCQNIDN